MRNMNTIEIIKKQINNNDIIIYMKGTPDEPMCGYSTQIVQIFKNLNINYKFIDVLKHPNIRKELPVYSNWPTFPQIYVKGKLIGGCDIISELYENNKLTDLLK